VTLIASGRLVSSALDAAETLAREGIQARVLDMHTIKPLDTVAVEQAAVETNAIVTVEDHNVIGGLGGAVAECLAERGLGRLVRVGLKDTFARSGSSADLYDRYGLSEPHIVAAARKAVTYKIGPELVR
jgi:transketolase